MILEVKKLKKLPVRTQSGQVLGKIAELEIDTEDFKIVKLVITKSKIVKTILDSQLIIDPIQVVEVTSKEIIVEDNLIKDKLANPAI